MTQIEQILAEIDRRIAFHKDRHNEHDASILDVLCGLKSSIESFTQDSTIEDVEELARKNSLEKFPPEGELQDCRWKQRAGYHLGFVAGAYWQKEKMMKDAIECEVQHPEVDVFKLEDMVEICPDGLMLDKNKFKAGDKVKVIVVPSDNKQN